MGLAAEGQPGNWLSGEEPEPGRWLTADDPSRADMERATEVLGLTPRQVRADYRSHGRGFYVFTPHLGLRYLEEEWAGPRPDVSSWVTEALQSLLAVYTPGTQAVVVVDQGVGRKCWVTRVVPE